MIKNALKFTKNGEVKIKAAYEEDTEQLKVRVIDSGVDLDLRGREIDTLFKGLSKTPRCE